MLRTTLLLAVLAAPLTGQSVFSFQQGVDDGAGLYTGTVDTGLDVNDQNADLSSDAALWIDGGSDARHVLLRFDGLVGTGPGQIPPGSLVIAAQLTLTVDTLTDSGTNNTHEAFRLLQPFTPSTTWSSGYGGDGVDADDVEADSSVAVMPSAPTGGTLTVSIVDAVQAWADGAPNHGLALLPDGTDGLRIQLSEAAAASARPRLVVTVLPAGLASFADVVASFDPMPGPAACALDESKALGENDFDGVQGCPNDVKFVSLGSGGSITLQFTDNSLTGSGDGDPDLWIFEVGTDVEDTFVEISTDAVTWHAVGKVFGSTSSIDIDAFGFGPTDLFAYVRLTDDPNQGNQSGDTVGADIDAVAAVASSPWIDLRSGLAGTLGVAPRLTGSGLLEPGGAFSLQLVDGLPNATCTLVFGLTQLGAPFKGGVLVPKPDVLVNLPLSVVGGFSLPAVWPVGVPAGLDVFTQVWLSDPGGPQGFAASNALTTTTF